MVIVSAVIPTRGRPELLAAGGTQCAGPDSARDRGGGGHRWGGFCHQPRPKELARQDERLRVIALAVSVGGSDARNRGVDAASGEWIAFLDDDDEWLPGKLQAQLDAVGNIDGARLDRYLQDDRAHPGQRLCVAAAHAGQQ